MKKIKWGIIGAGDIVRKRIIPAMQELESCEIFGITRSRPDLAREFAAEHGIANSYASIPDMLAEREIDAVYIASPVYLHAEHTIAAAEARKHVLCEKPMAIDTAECDRMIAACEANHVKLGIAYYRRFYPVIQRVRELLRSGEIGDPVFAQMNAFERFDPGTDHPRRWFVEKAKSGGGPMMDFGCHRLEILLYLFGTVRRIQSINANVIYDREVEDTSAALLQFESGPCASLVVTHAAETSLDTFSLFGTSGSVRIAALNSGEMVITTANGESIERHPPAANFHMPLIRDFVDSIVDEREPGITGATGREVAKLEDQIYGR